MKTLLIREFTREFSRHHAEPCLVKDRGRVVGTWTPAPGNPEPVNFAERAKEDFKRKLPFTFAALLKEGKKPRTFDGDQRTLAAAVRKFRSVPSMATA